MTIEWGFRNQSCAVVWGWGETDYLPAHIVVPNDGTLMLMWDADAGYRLAAFDQAAADQGGDGWGGATHYMWLPSPPPLRSLMGEAGAEPIMRLSLRLPWWRRALRLFA